MNMEEELTIEELFISEEPGDIVEYLAQICDNRSKIQGQNGYAAAEDYWHRVANILHRASWKIDMADV